MLLYTAVSIEYCRTFNLSNVNSSTMLCTSSTNDRDACGGDSGGPVICARGGSKYLAGVVSYGNKCANGTPSVNTNVSAFTNTINAAIANGVSLAIYSSRSPVFASFVLID